MREALYKVINVNSITNTIDGVMFVGEYHECEEYIDTYILRFPEFDSQDFIINLKKEELWIQ